jgi:adiponectin receptor
LIYDLKELKPLMKQMYFSKREFIRYGYRAHPNMTWGMCSKTLFMCHCETGNVWTHLLSAFYFMYQLMLLINKQGVYSEFETEESRIIQIIGCASIVFTMTASSFYH